MHQTAHCALHGGRKSSSKVATKEDDFSFLEKNTCILNNDSWNLFLFLENIWAKNWFIMQVYQIAETMWNLSSDGNTYKNIASTIRETQKGV